MSKQMRWEASDENVWYKEWVGNKSKLNKKSEPKKDVTKKKYFVKQKGPLQLKNGFYVKIWRKSSLRSGKNKRKNEYVCW